MSADIKETISKRYKRITKVGNKEFWNIESDTMHSLYVGFYGRGTAIESSDIDILLELPASEFNRYDNYKFNGQSQLLQSLKTAIWETYPNTDIKADGQVVVLNFTDGMKMEILPSFKERKRDGTISYKYPDTNMGGRWKSTNPKAEQIAIKSKDSSVNSNGLMTETCKHLRYIRDTYFSSYHFSGIVIDTFIYHSIGCYRFSQSGEIISCYKKTYESYLLEKLDYETYGGIFSPKWFAPGSDLEVDTSKSIICLQKVLYKINE